MVTVLFCHSRSFRRDDIGFLLLRCAVGKIEIFEELSFSDKVICPSDVGWIRISIVVLNE